MNAPPPPPKRKEKKRKENKSIIRLSNETEFYKNGHTKQEKKIFYKNLQTLQQHLTGHGT